MSSIKKFTHEGETLDYLEIKNGEHLPAIILLHGYGANMRDLAPLATLAPEFKHFNWYFPDGVLKVPIGPFMTGKAWFPIDMMALNQAMESGSFEHLFADELPEGLEEATQLIKAFILDLGQESPIHLGGFSQGSMLANHLVFNHGIHPQSLLLLSSTLVAKDRFSLSLKERVWDGPVFQSHGTEDPVLPVSMARALNEMMVSKGLNVDYYEFRGGHEIPPMVLQELKTFLAKKV